MKIDVKIHKNHIYQKIGFAPFQLHVLAILLAGVDLNIKGYEILETYSPIYNSTLN